MAGWCCAIAMIASCCSNCPAGHRTCPGSRSGRPPHPRRLVSSNPSSWHCEARRKQRDGTRECHVHDVRPRVIASERHVANRRKNAKKKEERPFW
eukprot:2971176-Prymnesium_polylepis.1